MRYGIPLLKINSKIDYFEETAFTSNGTLGIKVWVYEGNVNKYWNIAKWKGIRF